MNILFLGYDKKQTRLIDLLSSEHQIIHKSTIVHDLSDFDLIISFGYRHILTKKILNTAKRPVINLHTSYLPYNRGAHPNFWSFIENTPPGVTIHEVDDGIDTGPIIYQKYINFPSDMQSFSETYTYLIGEIEDLFLCNCNSILSANYQTKKQVGKGTYHNASELPENIKDWDISINEYTASNRDKLTYQLDKDLALVNEIQNVRSKNNVNWMDLLRIALKHSPKETKKVLAKINQDDNRISELFKNLAQFE